MKKDNLIIYGTLFTTMLISVAYAESERHIERPINHPKQNIKYSGNEPQGWDGVGGPKYSRSSDNNKSLPTYTEE